MKLPRRKQIKRRNNVAINERPRIFSYSSARSLSDRSTDRRTDQKPIEKQSEPIRSKLSKAVNYLIAVLILCGIAYMCILNPSAQIKVSGQDVYPRTKKSYEDGVDRQLKSSIFYRNKLTFDSSGVKDKIKNEFPEVEDVQIKISPFRHRPVIELSLAKPSERLISNGSSYILDDEGTALFNQNEASPSLDIGSLLTITDDTGHPVQLGKPALTDSQIGFIREVIGQTRAKGLSPESFTLARGGTELDVRFKDIKYFVKFSFMSDGRQSSGAFIALYQQFKNGSAPNQYIDLRIPDKAFVK